MGTARRARERRRGGGDKADVVSSTLPLYYFRRAPHRPTFECHVERESCARSSHVVSDDAEADDAEDDGSVERSSRGDMRTMSQIVSKRSDCSMRLLLNARMAWVRWDKRRA